MQFNTKWGNSRVHVLLIGHVSFCKCGMEGMGVLSSTHIITSRSSLQSICVIKLTSLKQLDEANDRMNSLWYAVKKIHVITEV
jgi:hypothetical protein